MVRAPLRPPWGTSNGTSLNSLSLRFHQDTQADMWTGAREEDTEIGDTLRRPRKPMEPRGARLHPWGQLCSEQLGSQRGQAWEQSWD